MSSTNRLWGEPLRRKLPPDIVSQIACQFPEFGVIHFDSGFGGQFLIGTTGPF
jgi:hypothetical protein